MTIGYGLTVSLQGVWALWEERVEEGMVNSHTYQSSLSMSHHLLDLPPIRHSIIYSPHPRDRMCHHLRIRGFVLSHFLVVLRWTLNFHSRLPQFLSRIRVSLH